MATLLAGLGQGITGAASAGATGIGGMIGSLLGGSIGSDLNKDTMGLGGPAIGAMMSPGGANNPAQTNVPSNPSGSQAQGAPPVVNPYQTGYQQGQYSLAHPNFTTLIGHLLGS